MATSTPQCINLVRYQGHAHSSSLAANRVCKRYDLVDSVPGFSGKILDPCNGGTNPPMQYVFAMCIEQVLTKYHINKLQNRAASDVL